MNHSIHPTPDAQHARVRALVEDLYSAACTEGRTLAKPKDRASLRAAFDRTYAAKAALLIHVEAAAEAVAR